MNDINTLRARMRPDSQFVIGGWGDEVYFGIRHADGTEEWLTPASEALVRDIEASASLPVSQRTRGKR